MIWSHLASQLSQKWSNPGTVFKSQRQQRILLSLCNLPFLCRLIVKVPISSIFIFPSDPIFHAIELRQKNFLFRYKVIFYEFLKTWKSYLCCWSQDWHTQSCDVDSGTCDFRLDLSHLFYNVPLNLISLSMQNAPFQQFVWTKLSYTKLKLKRLNKQDERSLKSHVP